MTSIILATKEDIPGLWRVAEDMKASHEPHYFERCLDEQAAGNRLVFVAVQGERLVGYAQLIWTPLYSTFRRLGIPEIQDLNVIPEARGQGLGAKLIETCEDEARKAGKTEMGISVGLTHSYGPAQRLYVQKNYVPDGTGMCYDDVPVRTEDLRGTLWRGPHMLDNLLTLKMIKTL